MPEKYDLSVHGWVNFLKGRGKLGGLFFPSLERIPRTPEHLLEGIERNDIDGIALVNFADNGSNCENYEKIEHIVLNEKVKGYELIRRIENAMLFESEDSGKQIAIIKAQEVPTEGNLSTVMAVGINSGDKIKCRAGLENALRDIRSKGAVSIAENYSNILFGGIGKERLLEFTGLIDGYEIFNANHGRVDGKEREEMEKLTGKKGIAVSDSHNIRDIGNGYIFIQSIDFTSRDNLVGSLKQILAEGKFIPIIRKVSSRVSLAWQLLLMTYDGDFRERVGLGLPKRETWKQDRDSGKSLKIEEARKESQNLVERIISKIYK